MPILHAIVLGVVQGLSEFLPISSSGHLVLVPWLADWQDFAHDPTLERSFDVALHIGTLVGALSYFWGDVVRLVRQGLTAPRSSEGRLAWTLLASAAPAAVTGALLADFIEEHTDQVWLIAVMLIVFGLVLFGADQLGARRKAPEFGLRDALAMGIGQALALQPGVSRSGVTMTVGRAIGFEREAAARLSFLMSLPIIGGAGLFQAADLVGNGGIPDAFVAPFVWGVAASAVTGWLAVWALLRLVRTRSFAPFVVYRVALGLAVLGLTASPLR